MENSSSPPPPPFLEAAPAGHPATRERPFDVFERPNSRDRTPNEISPWLFSSFQRILRPDTRLPGITWVSQSVYCAVNRGDDPLAFPRNLLVPTFACLSLSLCLFFSFSGTTYATTTIYESFFKHYIWTWEKFKSLRSSMQANREFEEEKIYTN